VTHHKLGRIQLHNIHDRGNLVALCSICHFAFDSDEWTFIPEDTRNWIRRIKATPQIIQEYNSQRDIVFRRLLLIPDPDSKAFQDTHYKSAFTDNPTRILPGEPGVVIVRPPPAFPPAPTAELQETLNDFEALQKIWLAYKSPCSEENCPICRSKSDGKQGKEDDKDDKDDEGDDENDEDDDEDDEDDDEDDEDDDEDDEDDDEDDEDDDEDSEENEECNENISRNRKSRKRISKKQPDSTGQQPSLQDVDIKKSTQASKHRKNLKNMERDWMTSAPYDESIPYSHRYGYTWAGSTSNELMKLWQVYRKLEDD